MGGVFTPAPIVVAPMDPDIDPDSPAGSSGHGPGAWVSCGSKKRKPPRLRQEGAVAVAIMMSDTRGLWHADIIRSVAARPRGAKSASGVLGLVLTRWRLTSTDAGALDLHELECRRLQAGTLSGFVGYLCLATAAGAECRVALGHHALERPQCKQFTKKFFEKSWAEPQQG